MATYDLFLTQRLIAQPRVELNAAVQDVRKFGVQRGFNDIELGLRVRYEVRREIAPYLGINWIRQLEKTADLARQLGQEVDSLGFVAGLRIQF
jgi:copper resistance protein B